jgi:hypothetical protein
MRNSITDFSPIQRIEARQLLSPTPKINLATTEDIRREMSRVYRESRSNKLATSEGTKLIYMLTQILKATELYILEKRLIELENAHLKAIQ